MTVRYRWETQSRKKTTTHKQNDATRTYAHIIKKLMGQIQWSFGKFLFIGGSCQLLHLANFPEIFASRTLLLTLGLHMNEVDMNIHTYLAKTAFRFTWYDTKSKQESKYWRSQGTAPSSGPVEFTKFGPRTNYLVAVATKTLRGIAWKLTNQTEKENSSRVSWKWKQLELLFLIIHFSVRKFHFYSFHFNLFIFSIDFWCWFDYFRLNPL